MMTRQRLRSWRWLQAIASGPSRQPVGGGVRRSYRLLAMTKKQLALLGGAVGFLAALALVGVAYLTGLTDTEETTTTTTTTTTHYHGRLVFA